MPLIINARGEEEEFSRQKVYSSVRRVSGSDKLADEISRLVQKEIYPGIKTSDISKEIKRALSKRNKKGAIRFSLKHAMRQLGPTGFLFEKFVAGIFKDMGYSVKIDQYIPGHCVKEYEIDLIAQKDNLVYVGECKYRNVPGDMVHLHDALANYARFQDILKGRYFKRDKYDNCTIKTILITNTKFTNNAFDYSSCSGVGLLGWRTPKDSGLEHIIESRGLYPVTLLSSLKGYLKDIVVQQEMMFVSDVLRIDPERFAKEFNVPVESVYSLVKEARILLGD